MPRWMTTIRAWWFAFTILLSAFLVFQVQPVISKIILPWFGGTPAVWTTCVLFFQIVLFVGYAYAHVLTKFCAVQWQGLIHISLLAAALFCLPITPGDGWKPTGSDSPTLKILAMLLANVGLPYFLLSTTGPLLQAWFSRSCAGRSPYRLYALSNIGSLAALLSYPFLFEPLMSTWKQDTIWSFGFSLFAVACSMLAVQMWRFRACSEAVTDVNCPASTNRVAPARSATLWQKCGWLLFPAIASVTLLATTNHVCQDIAVVPFLWVLPLSLYLVTFIICFDKESWYSRRWMSALVLLGIAFQCFLLMDNFIADWLINHGIDFPINQYTNHLFLDATTYLVVLFCICMLCHGELVKNKPQVHQLTSFYLACGAGGAIGGSFVGLVCPSLFSTYFEMQLALILAVVVAAVVFWVDASQTYLADQPGRRRILRAVAIICCFLVMRIQMASVQYGSLATMRNFYGVLRVDDFSSSDGNLIAKKLVHGTTVHGFQFFQPEKKGWPTTYYGQDSGVGIAIRHYQEQGPIRVGVVGLGCGTLAAYGRSDDYFRFYEINPHVIDVAHDQFSYLGDSAARVETVLGDARLSLEAEVAQQFDVLVLDAFSSDAIPAHLLTTEAFEVYLRHLKPNGMIAVHVSNRHLKLPPVVSRIARYHGMIDAFVGNREQTESHTLAAQWMLVTRDATFVQNETIRPRLRKLSYDIAATPLWTDQFNNLYQILRLTF